MSQSIQFDCPDGSKAPGLWSSVDEAAPGVVLIQEWWGVNDQMRGVAARLVEAGHNVLVPDLYRGRVAGDADEANHMMNNLDWPGATHQDLPGAAQYVAAKSSAVAVMGFCMGGALTIAGAVHAPGLDAGVCFYGIPPRELADPQAIGIPMLFHFAERDDWCTPEAVADLEGRLDAGGVDYTLHKYAADHAFFNEARPEVYDAAASELAWSRTLEFLGRLKG